MAPEAGVNDPRLSQRSSVNSTLSASSPTVASSFPLPNVYIGIPPAYGTTMAETLAVYGIIIFTILLTAALYSRGGAMQPDLDGPPPPHVRPLYRYGADGFARDTTRPIVLLTRLDPNATYSQDSLNRHLKRQGIDVDLSECEQLAMSPAAAAQFTADMSRRQRMWEKELRIEVEDLESEAFW